VSDRRDNNRRSVFHIDPIIVISSLT
jgi:hypothetical protein